MTLYIPQLNELPLDNMRTLEPTAQCSVTKSGGAVTAITYEWSDLRVAIHITSGPQLAEHLQGFIGYIRHGCAKMRKPLNQPLEDRILSTTLVAGFVVERTAIPDGWRDRVQRMIGTIASNTGALIFWEGSVFDQNSERLFPA
jgi:hypothetical protein